MQKYHPEFLKKLYDIKEHINFEHAKVTPLKSVHNV